MYRQQQQQALLRHHALLICFTCLQGAGHIASQQYMQGMAAVSMHTRSRHRCAMQRMQSLVAEA
jgi:hypothetical protein